MPTFQELRDECLKNGTIYEDPDFPPTKNIPIPPKKKGAIIWRRPIEIVENPVFMREATYYDINQGELGDCFLLAAVQSLMANDKKMLQKVMPGDQDFKDKYAGIFHFNFWQYGVWKEIVIDDRLPTRGGELIYGNNRKEPDEFWFSLLEKAYAKLRGSYNGLDGGFTENVLVDLTGGISERIELENTDYNCEQLFKILYMMWRMDSLVSLAIYQSDGGREAERENGLLEGHAYSLTKIAMVSFHGRTERLLRLRNPWGQHEWNGAWSDKSAEWNSFSEEDRKKMQLTIDNNGEFWIRLEDVMTEFDAFTICHKDESALTSIIRDSDAQKAKWSSHVFKDRWVKHISSGGSDPDSDIYWRNPQYVIDLEHRSQDTWTVLSLMEVMTQIRDHADIAIGFDIYKLKPGVKRPRSYRFEKDALRLTSFARTTRLREQSTCLELPPGIFVVVVYNSERFSCEYLMRIYCECKADVIHADDVTTEFTDDEKSLSDDTLKNIFDRYCDPKDNNVDAFALRKIMEETWIAEFQAEIELTLETSRCLMNFVDPLQMGVIDLHQTRNAYKTIITWMKMFFVFDQNKSYTIETSELMNTFNLMGFTVGRKVAESAAIRYGGRNGKISSDDFIQCICRFFSISKVYKRLGLTDIDVSLTDFLSEAIRT